MPKKLPIVHLSVFICFYFWKEGTLNLLTYFLIQEDRNPNKLKPDGILSLIWVGPGPRPKCKKAPRGSVCLGLWDDSTTYPQREAHTATQSSSKTFIASHCLSRVGHSFIAVSWEMGVIIFSKLLPLDSCGASAYAVGCHLRGEGMCSSRSRLSRARNLLQSDASAWRLLKWYFLFLAVNMIGPGAKSSPPCMDGALSLSYV